MINYKLIPKLTIIIMFGLTSNLLNSCSENKSKASSNNNNNNDIKMTSQKYDGVTI
jgi:hypothetical protein